MDSLDAKQAHHRQRRGGTTAGMAHTRSAAIMGQPPWDNRAAQALGLAYFPCLSLARACSALKHYDRFFCPRFFRLHPQRF